MSMLKVNSHLGLLEPVTYRPSAHCDHRPHSMEIDMIVIHGISLPPGEFGTNAIENFFCGKLDTSAHPFYASIANLKVSAHLLIKRNGHIIQFVPFTKRAWHAGESFYNGKSQCNDFSIGIELEGTDHLPYEPDQYQQLAAISRLLICAYPAIRHDRIVGHVDIAPHRKTDPGPAFDWGYFRKLVE